MCKIVFLGDNHAKDNSIALNYGRYKHNYEDLPRPFILLLEVDYDGRPEEGNAGSARTIVTDLKRGGKDAAFLSAMADNAFACYGFDSDGGTFSKHRHDGQYENIEALVENALAKNMNVLVVVGEAHLERLVQDECPEGWDPHHEKLDGKERFGNKVFCYSMLDDGEELDYDDK